jgi:hypothetical protein
MWKVWYEISDSYQEETARKRSAVNFHFHFNIHIQTILTLLSRKMTGVQGHQLFHRQHTGDSFHLSLVSTNVLARMYFLWDIDHSGIIVVAALDTIEI